MGWYKNWASRQSGKTSLLFLSIASASVCFMIGYKQYYAPWRAKRRLREAEEFANVLLSSEK